MDREVCDHVRRSGWAAELNAWGPAGATPVGWPCGIHLAGRAGEATCPREAGRPGHEHEHLEPVPAASATRRRSQRCGLWWAIRDGCRRHGEVPAEVAGYR